MGRRPPQRALTARKFLQMPRNGETGPGGNIVEIPEPRTCAAFEIRAVAAEAVALRRAGGDIGHRVEGCIGVFAEFVEVGIKP